MRDRRQCLVVLQLAMNACCGLLHADEQPPQTDYLDLAQGALPVTAGIEANGPGIGIEQALLAIDGDAGGFVVTPKPRNADARVTFVYQLPAVTTFTGFAVPNVLETPSPSQTFFRAIEISGSAAGPEGPYQQLARAVMARHGEAGELTRITPNEAVPVRWVRVSLAGGLDIQREKTFFEFSEIIGYGTQEPVPLSASFNGRWKGRGVLLELQQQGAMVTGCYDRVGDLNGTVTGNLLRATGRTRNGDIPSVFVLAVDENGQILGVRSTNGAPFRLYAGNAVPDARTQCGELSARPPGCGAVIHGIQFDFDSAVIRPESGLIIDSLSVGLRDTAASDRIVVIGHTSSEGSEAYNEQLSQRRAAAVVDALIARGIDAGRISAEGLGEQQPIADNETEAGRSLNRRVEIACR